MVKDDKNDLEATQERVKHGRQQDEGVLVIRTIAMPSDTNPSGDIFGGWLMYQSDVIRWI